MNRGDMNRGARKVRGNISRKGQRRARKYQTHRELANKEALHFGEQLISNEESSRSHLKAPSIRNDFCSCYLQALSE